MCSHLDVVFYRPRSIQISLRSVSSPSLRLWSCAYGKSVCSFWCSTFVVSFLFLQSIIWTLAFSVRGIILSADESEIHCLCVFQILSVGLSPCTFDVFVPALCGLFSWDCLKQFADRFSLHLSRRMALLRWYVWVDRLLSAGVKKIQFCDSWRGVCSVHILRRSWATKTKVKTNLYVCQLFLH